MNASDSDFARGVKTFGDRRNPPILFLHGIRLAGAIWDAHARDLCDDYFVITPDLPGHGTLAHLPFDIPTCEAFLEYIAQNVTQRPPLVVGYSLGGYVAMRYATDQPESTAGLLITGCSADVVGIRALIYEICVGITAQFSQEFVQKMLAVAFRITLPRKVANLIIPFAFNQQVFETSRKTVSEVAYSERLRTYAKPMLIVNGEYDILFRPDENKYAEAARARVIIMRNSDHVAPLRRPRHFTAIVRRFARRVFGRRRHPES